MTSVERIRYSYFTAGSGGAGKTLIVTTLMLLGEQVVAFRDNQAVTAPPMSQPTTVDFGPGQLTQGSPFNRLGSGAGRRGVFLLNLPEVKSAHTVFGASNASARFGSAPKMWNWLLWAMARSVPLSILQNRNAMSKLASFSWPITRFVDQFVGESVAMRIDIEFNDEKTASGIYYHEKLSESLGACVAAFARCLLNKETSPGVWHPEEPGAMINRKSFLKDASEGCQRLILNRPPWQIESDPTRIGLGLYVY